MSDTPETNAMAFDAFDGQGGDEVVFANLARRFERERNKAEAGWLECRNFAQQMVNERDNFQDQRDFAMGEIERLRKEAAQKDKLIAEMREAIRWVADDSCKGWPL